MNNITIVPTTKEHLDNITAIEAVCFSTPWSRNAFESGMNQNTTQSYFTALHNERVVGYICLFHLFEEGELLNIAVDPTYRKMGIGQKMIDLMFTLLNEKGVTRITLEVRESNLSAKNLYEKNGFKLLNIRKNYYSCPTENGLVMEKQL